MSGRNVWTRSRERVKRFPELLARCSVEAAAYGKCVVSTTTGKQELKKDLCLKEFKTLKTCFINAVGKSGDKIGCIQSLDIPPFGQLLYGHDGSRSILGNTGCEAEIPPGWDIDAHPHPFDSGRRKPTRTQGKNI